MFFIPEDFKKQKKPKDPPKRPKDPEFDEDVKKEMLKRNRHPKNPQKPLHPTWILKIKKELEEKKIIKDGWKGTKTMFHEIGDKNTIPEVILENGKKKMNEYKQKRKDKLEKMKMKKQKNIVWEAKHIKFCNDD